LITTSLEFFNIIDTFIDLFGLDFHNTIFVLLIFSQEIHKMNGGFLFEFIEDFRFELSEIFKRDFVNIVLDLVLFFVVGQFIHKDSFALVSPKGNEEDFGFETQGTAG